MPSFFFSPHVGEDQSKVPKKRKSVFPLSTMFELLPIFPTTTETWSLQGFKIVGFSVCWSNLRFAYALRISPTKIIFVGEIPVPMALFQLQQSSEIKRCWSLLDLRIKQNHFLWERFLSMSLFQQQQSSRIKRCWSLLNLRIPFA